MGVNAWGKTGVQHQRQTACDHHELPLPTHPIIPSRAALLAVNSEILQTETTGASWTPGSYQIHFDARADAVVISAIVDVGHATCRN